MRKVLLSMAMIGILAGSASAATPVSADITISTSWTKANSPYYLTKQIFVTNSAVLTIDAGVVVASYKPDQGSLCISRGSQIYVNGTASEPVIMTSAEDVATWSGSSVVRDATGDVVDITTLGDPATGTWREAAVEWGNLTILGNGLISASHYGGLPVGSNTVYPDGGNEKLMEGLADDPKAYYGGSDDDESSGSISHLSIRYGGKVIGFANELNGLSLGGIGRGTDIEYVEIMNNVDDGIEIWGGTVNLKYVSIWNVGDDSFDVDEGWRGKAQFGLIVQGYSLDAGQGSGVGDNCFEMDGAEDYYAQPVTTTTIYNFTCVGQPAPGAGDHGAAFRDNARVQYRNCIWMELGDELIRFDNDDGDGALGYSGTAGLRNRTTSYPGLLSWNQTWTTAAAGHCPPVSAMPVPTPGINDCASLYTVQTSGNLCEVTYGIFYNNISSAAYTESNLLGVTSGGGSSGTNIVATNMPIQSITRGSAVVKGTKTMLPVTHIDPRAANDAISSAHSANPAEGFWTTANFVGAFDNTTNWLEGWTAAHAYGMTGTPADVTDWQMYH